MTAAALGWLAGLLAFATLLVIGLAAVILLMLPVLMLLDWAAHAYRRLQNRRRMASRPGKTAPKG